MTAPAHSLLHPCANQGAVWLLEEWMATLRLSTGELQRPDTTTIGKTLIQKEF